MGGACSSSAEDFLESFFFLRLGQGTKDERILIDSPLYPTAIETIIMMVMSRRPLLVLIMTTLPAMS